MNTSSRTLLIVLLVIIVLCICLCGAAVLTGAVGFLIFNSESNSPDNSPVFEFTPPFEDWREIIPTLPDINPPPLVATPVRSTGRRRRL
ncbi:MAG: hypothetical protein KatS3mg046_720 [Bellilinea sp.]|nr:MAG: hypothetical protein KatS3mg046_720 [Bellilinea sp.]